MRHLPYYLFGAALALVSTSLLVLNNPEQHSYVQCMKTQGHLKGSLESDTLAQRAWLQADRQCAEQAHAN